MARGLNKVMLIGHLGKDPEMRFTQGGMAVATFSLATSENWLDKATNEKKERTEWHRIVAFGKLGEICGEYLSKGKQVYIEGKLQTRSWEQDGVTKYTTEIVASDMQMLDSKGAVAGSENAGYGSRKTGGAAQPPSQGPGHGSGGGYAGGPSSMDTVPPPPGNFDDDIPF
jgi:single-strand DNA-binding protein